MKRLLLLVVLVLMTSCASTMPGGDLRLNSTVLSGTLKENSDFSNDKIKMYQISIKNNSQDWVTMDSALLINAPKSKLLLGDKISSWMEACSLEKRVADYNMALIVNSVAIAGATVAVGSKNTKTSNVGLATVVGAVGAGGIKEFMDSKNKADFQEVLPEGHIFRPFTIPPMKVIQRWVLIEREDGEKPGMTLISQDKKIGEVSFLFPFAAEPGKDDYPEEPRL